MRLHCFSLMFWSEMAHSSAEDDWITGLGTHWFQHGMGFHLMSHFAFLFLFFFSWCYLYSFLGCSFICIYISIFISIYRIACFRRCFLFFFSLENLIFRRLYLGNGGRWKGEEGCQRKEGQWSQEETNILPHQGWSSIPDRSSRQIPQERPLFSARWNRCLSLPCCRAGVPSSWGFGVGWECSMG